MKAEEADDEARTEALEESISSHIFSTSATMVGVCLTAMVGVCLTAMGLFRLVNELRKVNGIADNLLALDALAFLLSCLLSCGSLRSGSAKRTRKREKLADIIFMAALTLLAIIAGLIAYEIA